MGLLAVCEPIPDYSGVQLLGNLQLELRYHYYSVHHPVAPGAVPADVQVLSGLGYHAHTETGDGRAQQEIPQPRRCHEEAAGDE